MLGTWNWGDGAFAHRMGPEAADVGAVSPWTWTKPFDRKSRSCPIGLHAGRGLVVDLKVFCSHHFMAESQRLECNHKWSRTFLNWPRAPESSLCLPVLCWHWFLALRVSIQTCRASCQSSASIQSMAGRIGREFVGCVWWCPIFNREDDDQPVDLGNPTWNELGLLSCQVIPTCLADKYIYPIYILYNHLI